ncbi:MAG: dTDP-4-amino-4,6-dideoxygalactose transaminase [Moraxellaceae bacterium]|nr:dTDP-4-amino-4,6-dideoxygalactose transaminase [Moraxellaceae bacterium]
MQEVLRSGQLSAGGLSTAACEGLMRQHTGSAHVLLTHSCTAALELAAILSEVGPGDEVILPSFTFPSTANAFVLRGATPTFVDIRPDTLNLDETLVEAAITPRTRAIVAVHYAGVPCDLEALSAIAHRHGLLLIEDAAQAYLSSWQGRAAGTWGDLATFSFHGTKNLSCGEGGALLCNSASLARRAVTLRDKGTDRQAFLVGQVPRYSWIDCGTSAAIGELAAACLRAQLEEAEHITARRVAAWVRYDAALCGSLPKGFQTPVVPAAARHNGHLYYLLVPAELRDALLRHLAQAGIEACSHYEPLHTARAAARFASAPGPMLQSESLPARLVRLPLWCGISDVEIDQVVAEVRTFAERLPGRARALGA